MKRLAFFGLIGLALIAGFSHKPVDALQSTKAYKQVVLTIIVTPSPIAYHPAGGRPAINVAHLLEDPYHGTMRVASGGATYDVPMVLAQATPQGNIPVTFTSHADPTAQYLHIVPINTTLMAGYGTTTFTCPFEVYAYYTTTWKVTDWGYGTVSSGSGAYPVENYPTASDLSWDIPSIGNNTFAAYSNSGSPGQLAFNGTAGVSQQPCINLSLYVPNTLAPGDYTAAIQYNLIAN